MAACPTPAPRLRRRLPASLGSVDALCAQVRRLLADMHLCDHDFAVQLLLREALNNAVLHGSGGDERKTIECDVRVIGEWIVIRVVDEGRGFDGAALEEPAGGELAASGRGLCIYGLYADRVRFNDRGNRVALFRRVRR